MQRELTKKEKFLQGLSSALYAYRYILIGILAAITIFVITWFIVSEVQKKRLESSTVLAEIAQSKFDSWISEEDEENAQAMAEDLLSDIARIIDLYPRLYAAQRSLLIQGQYFYETEQWTQAAASFELIAERFPASYLAPSALINAAVAYEELADISSAMELYKRILDEYETRSYEIPHVLFSLGRLSEKSTEEEEALTYYNRIVDGYPGSSWTNLARDRIIYLNID